MQAAIEIRNHSLSPFATKRDMKVQRWIYGFWSFLPWTLAMSQCSEEDWKEKIKKKRYVS
jgi:hypothetical protein